MSWWHADMVTCLWSSRHQQSSVRHQDMRLWREWHVICISENLPSFSLPSGDRICTLVRGLCTQQSALINGLEVLLL